MSLCRCAPGGALLLLGLVGGPLSAQALPLAEAFRRADAQGWGNRLAAADGRVRHAEADRAFQGILPTVRAEGGWMKTTDPLGAFGSALRQRSLTPASFDPAKLNNPQAIADVGSAAVVEIPLVNIDAWAGRKAGASAASAAEAMADWTRTGTRLDVVRAYFGGVLAREKVATLEAAVATAESHVRQAESFFRNGMVTKSDVLLGQVKMGELAADLVSARADQALATVRLAMVLGAPGDTTLVLPASLPTTAQLRALELSLPADAALRADVAAAGLGRDAARNDVRRVSAQLLPRLNGFARWDYHTPATLFGGQAGWTVGVMGSWVPFNGGAALAERAASRSRADAASAMAEAAEAQARLQLAETASALTVAGQRLGIADTAISQASEAHRIVAKKYAGGLATITDLLAVVAAETGARLARSAAAWQYLVALGERQRALGLDLSALTLLAP